MNKESKELLNKAKANLANGLMIGAAVSSIIGGAFLGNMESMILGVLVIILWQLFELNKKLDKQ